MLEKKFFISSSDADRYQEAKLSSLFRFFQDAATEHAELLGIGKSLTLDAGLAWIISRMKVVMYRYPKYEETIIIKTYPGDNKFFIFPRYFVIESLNGEVLGRCSSLWAVMDLKTRKISFDPFHKKELPSEHMKDELDMPEKVKYYECSSIENRKVRYSETDLNGHLNNTKYIEYIVDAFSPDIYKNKRIVELIINFEKEISEDNTVNIQIDSNNELNYVFGSIEGLPSFTSQIKFENR